jgi:putative transposase
MLKAYKYRVYPTKEQEILLNKHFGTARFVYNKCLGLKIDKYTENQESISRFELQVLMKELKNTEEYFWLNEINSQTVQYAIKNLDDAYKNFLKLKKGFPKFKKKGTRDSFACPQFVSINKNEINIPKFKEGLKIIVDRKYKGEIKSATFSKRSSGKYFVSVLCDTHEEIPFKKEIKKETAIGIDLGLKHFLILSDGRKVENPHFYKKSLKKIQSISRSLSRKENGSNRYIKNKIKLAKTHEKVANQRTDFLHKLSTEIVNQYDNICVENLNVKGMVKNKHLSQSISDVSWSEFIRMVDYKFLWKGKNLLQIDRFEASSKTCSHCGFVKKDLKLEDRQWICPHCGKIHDRDINAALNVVDFAFKKLMRVESPSKNVECGSVDDRFLKKKPKKHLHNEALKILIN